MKLSVTKNSNTKTWTFGLLGKYTENSNISLSSVLLKIVTLIILSLNELQIPIHQWPEGVLPYAYGSIF